MEPTPALGDNALRVLEHRYLRKDEQGRVVETPGEMLARVARAVAAAEALYPNDPEASVERAERRFLDALVRLEFLPNSPALMNAGRELGQLAACFVLPVEDSLDGIFDALKHAAKIHQSGGGTGFSFSRLRARGDRVRTTGGASSGPLSFLRIFDEATEAIQQGGFRRGANMGVLRVDHPDVLEFVDAKREPGAIENFNLSVAVTDAFMQAVERDEEYALVSPRTGEPTGKRLRAREVFDRIADAAWRSAEPGVLFIDAIARADPTSHVAPIEATNPCGEQPLPPYDSCTLASVDLGKFVRGEPWTGLPGEARPDVDWDRLAEAVRTGVLFLEDVLDANRYPLPAIEAMVKRNRRIGLGVMGLADLLVRLGVPYASEEAVAWCDRIMAFVEATGHEASRALARRRGPFPSWQGSLWERGGAEPLRHATVTTVAPTGSISLIAGCSSGIEPHFGLAWTKHCLDGQRLPEVNADLVRVARARGLDADGLVAHVTRTGTLRGYAGAPGDLLAVFQVAQDVPPEAHLRIQAAFQRHVDSAVSKTINFPRDAATEDVRAAYMLAWKLGLKGVTVYRDGCRAGQVLTLGAGTPHDPEAPCEDTPAPTGCGNASCG